MQWVLVFVMEGILVYRALGPYLVLHLSSIVNNQLKGRLTNLDVIDDCLKTDLETEIVLDELTLYPRTLLCGSKLSK